MLRGALQFEVADNGDLLNSAGNVETLRRLWLHPTLVAGEDLGPGNRGDFEYGAWHVSCHLAGAGGIRRSAEGNLLWLEISRDHARDFYYASVTTRRAGALSTVPIDSAEGRSWLAGTTLKGFVEGTSLGRISARGVQDPPDLFNLWRRQDFDQPVESPEDGGKVWEHWCTLRDIRASHRIGTSMLTAYISLAAALGDRFIATVARGRRTYGHPTQLAAMVWAGLCSRGSATRDFNPHPIPEDLEPLFSQAEPGLALDAVERLSWPGQRYYMFRRKIGDWSRARLVRGDIDRFKVE